MPRQTETMNKKQFESRLHGAYMKLLEGDDAKLVKMDIVDFAGLMRLTNDLDKTPNNLLIMEGRRQMAMHILRHYDLDPIELIQMESDSKIAIAHTESDPLGGVE